MFGKGEVQNDCRLNHTNGMSAPAIPQHIETAIGFANHMVESFPIEHQNEMLLAIQKRIIEHRRTTLDELDLQIKRAQENYDKVLGALNVIS